jgi:hypothetical protein
MTTPPQDDAFAAEIRSQLERADQVMTQVVADPATRAEFVSDPIGVLSRLGLFPSITPESRDRANRMFYAVLQNTDLVQHLQDTFASFRAENEDLLAGEAEAVQGGLRQGVMAHSPEFEMAAVDHVFRNPYTLRELYRLALHDLNNRRLFHRVYTAQELDTYISDVVTSVQQRRPVSLGPPQINGPRGGPPGGGGGGGGVNVTVDVNVAGNINVAGAINAAGVVNVAVAGALEVALGITVFVVVFGPDLLSGGVTDSAVLGDSEAVRALATAGALLNLAGEVLVHANNLERG